MIDCEVGLQSERPYLVIIDDHGLEHLRPRSRSDGVRSGGLEHLASRALVESAEHAELFLYPGDQHLFADDSLPSYDANAAALLSRRVLDFLGTR